MLSSTKNTALELSLRLIKDPLAVAVVQRGGDGIAETSLFCSWIWSKKTWVCIRNKPLFFYWSFLSMDLTEKPKRGVAIKKQQSQCYCMIGGISAWLSQTVWKHTNHDQEYGALTLYFIPITTPNAKPSCQLPILCTLSVLGVCLSPCVCCVFVIISVNSQRILLQLLFVISHVYKLCVLLRREKWKCFLLGLQVAFSRPRVPFGDCVPPFVSPSFACFVWVLFHCCYDVMIMCAVGVVYSAWI